MKDPAGESLLPLWTLNQGTGKMRLINEPRQVFHSTVKEIGQGKRYFTALQHKMRAGIALLLPPPWSREQLPGELEVIFTLFHLQRDRPTAITSGLVAGYRPEHQRFLPE